MQTTRTLLVVEIRRVVVQDEAVALLPVEELGATSSCRRGRIRGTSSVVRAAARWILQTVSSTHALGRGVVGGARDLALRAWTSPPAVGVALRSRERVWMAAEARRRSRARARRRR